MSNKVKKFRVWQEAHNQVKEIYRATSYFPVEERYGIVSQLRRAAYSIPANLAEGCERKHPKEFIQFVYIARGSLSELRYFLLLANELSYLNDEDYSLLEQKSDAIMAMLCGLTEFLEEKVLVGNRKSEIGYRDSEVFTNE